MEKESPYLQIWELKEVCINLQNISVELKLNVFPFSLNDKAKTQLYSLRPKLIVQWDEMQKEFLNIK